MRRTANAFIYVGVVRSSTGMWIGRVSLIVGLGIEDELKRDDNGSIGRIGVRDRKAFFF